MAEQSAQDRTEQPTPRRREEARDKGQLARSQDLNSVAVLLGGLIVLKFFGRQAVQGFVDFSVYIYGNLSTFKLTVSSFPLQFYEYINYIIGTFAIILLGISIFPVLSNLAQDNFRLNISKKALEPKFNQLNPVENFKKLFSMNSIVELIKGMFKFSIVGFIAYLVIRKYLVSNQFWAIYNSSVEEMGLFFGKVFFEIGFKTAIVLLILGLADFGYQIYQNEKKLKMSKQEVKDERKQFEGNPEIKGRMRAIQRQLSRSRMMANVPEATVVVTNPTFIAIAIKYEPKEKHDAPKVVAKGKRKIAEKIREIAKENNIPIIENKPLARGLYEFVEIGMQIPFEFYQAVAEVLAKVYSLRKKRKI
ncbi:MAG: flagellar biosynthesis protein FlhB [Candidatus Marinimicrobia bacterium]|nr:flagellar biosynthesis protein FlhB [Candidatus Neomarinimicrobiota bacterium]